MPFGDYKDFDDCVSKNKDKKSPEGYCAALHKKITGKWPNEKENIGKLYMIRENLDINKVFWDLVGIVEWGDCVSIVLIFKNLYPNGQIMVAQRDRNNTKMGTHIVYVSDIGYVYDPLFEEIVFAGEYENKWGLEDKTSVYNGLRLKDALEYTKNPKLKKYIENLLLRN